MARREAELLRLVIEHPNWSTSQLAYTLSLPEPQTLTSLQTLARRGQIEEVRDGWVRRRSSVRAWRRDDPHAP